MTNRSKGLYLVRITNPKNLKGGFSMFKHIKYVTLAALVALNSTTSVFATAIVTDIYKETIDNVTLQAQTLSPEQAKEAFGHDMYSADIIPVAISIANNSLEPRIFSAKSLDACGLITKNQTMIAWRFHEKNNLSNYSKFLAYLAGCIGVTFILDTARTVYSQPAALSIEQWHTVSRNSNLMALASKTLLRSCLVIPTIGALLAIRKTIATGTAFQQMINDKNVVIDSGKQLVTYAFINKRDINNDAYISLNVTLEGYLQRAHDHHYDVTLNHQSEVTFNAMIPNLK